MKGQAVVLLSGGADSAAVLYLARKQGYAVRPLIFDYGQRHKREIRSALSLSRALGAKPVVLKISLPWKGSALTDALLPIPGKRTRGIPLTYVPGRNIIFLSFALSYAEAVGAKAIFIGAHTEDYSGYPDCRKEFFDAFKAVKDAGTKYGKKIRLKMPLLRMNKAGIIRLGSELKVPFDKTWSCYKGGKKPCGVCDSCRYRAKGFKEAGVTDPLVTGCK